MSKTTSKYHAIVPAIFKSDTLACEIRVIRDNPDNPWFVASDVAKRLGYRDATNAIRNIEHGIVATHRVSMVTKRGVRQSREMTLIDETGLYEVIFASTKREAQEFKLWVLKEVLPSIRKHGGYMVGQDQFSEEFTHALFKHMQDMTRRALHRFDKLTETNHFTAFKNPKQAREMTEKAIVEVSEQFGLSLEMMEIIADGRHRPSGKKAA